MPDVSWNIYSATTHASRNQSHICLYKNICMYVCMYVCMCVCMCIITMCVCVIIIPFNSGTGVVSNTNTSVITIIATILRDITVNILF